MTDLRLVAVGLAYSGDSPVQALRDVSINVDHGEFVAIVGPSGSGKSTLLNIVAMLDRPTVGRYLLGGQDTAGLGERERARIRSRTFGFVFQGFHLLDRRTVAENVALGLRYHSLSPTDRRDLVATAVERVGLAHRMDQQAMKLSGGERQRVAIARAVVGGAPVIVADEPTGNLDSVTSGSIMNNLRDLNAAGTTVVLVTHDREVASVASRRVTLRDGVVQSDSRDIGRRTTRANAAPPPEARVPGRLRLASADATRSLTSRPGRTTALSAMVAIAVALAIATIGLSQSASAQVSERFDAQRNREVTASTGNVLTAGTAASPVVAAPAAAERRVTRLVGVDRAGVLVGDDSHLLRASLRQPAVRFPIAGASPGLLATVGADVQWAPRHRHRLGAGELLLGSVPAHQMGVAPLVLDPTVVLDNVPFAVAGIIRDVRRDPDLLASVVGRQADLGPLSDPSQVTVLIETASGAAQQVAGRAAIALDPADPGRFSVTAPVDPQSLRAEIESDVGTSLLVLTVVAAIAAVVATGNAMAMGVVERIGEIGLRRALGARPVHIAAQITTESTLLGAFGGVAGLVAGMAAILGVTVVERWQPVFDVRLIPVALVGGALVGMIGSLAATVRAGRIQPSDALRR